MVKCFLYAAADPSVALKSYRYLTKRGYCIAWKGFFTQSQVLLSSIGDGVGVGDGDGDGDSDGDDERHDF